MTTVIAIFIHVYYFYNGGLTLLSVFLSIQWMPINFLALVLLVLAIWNDLMVLADRLDLLMLLSRCNAFVCYFLMNPFFYKTKRKDTVDSKTCVSLHINAARSHSTLWEFLPYKVKRAFSYLVVYACFFA